MTGRKEADKETWSAARLRLKRLLLERLDYSRELSDEEILALIDDTLLEESGREAALRLSIGEKKRMRLELFYAIRKLDVLQELIDDPEITDVGKRLSNTILRLKKRPFYGGLRHYPRFGNYR